MLYNPNWIDTDKLAKRAALVSLLRDRSKWPSGFVWNYEYYQQCAMGLAFRTGIVTRDPWGRNSETMAAQLGLSQKQAKAIFVSKWRCLASYFLGYKTSPKAVARMLEKTL